MKNIAIVILIVMTLAGGIDALNMVNTHFDTSPTSPVCEGDCWAIVFHFQPFRGWACDRDIKEILAAGGWQYDHIKIFKGEEINRKNFFESFSWLDAQEASGDTVLFFYNGPGHKGGIKLYNNEYYVSYPELAFLFDNLEAKKIGIVLDACHSGVAKDYLQGEGRTVITGASENEKIGNFMLSNLLLDGLDGLGDYKGNRDGFVSMEEAFTYVQEQWIYDSHPQIYDDHRDDLILTVLQDDDQVDQCQTLGNRAIEISDIQWLAQSFQPTYEQVTRATLYVRCDINTEGTLEVALRESLEGQDICSYTIPPMKTPGWYWWIDFDFPDFLVSPGKQLFLVCRMPQNIIGSDIYEWRGESGDIYESGQSYISFNQGKSWEENPSAADCVFITFGRSQGNTQPNKPSRPIGETGGKTGISYSYSSMATDPEGDQLHYNFSWGDGTYSDWIGPYNSNETVTAIHAWDTRGSFNIQVKAKDSNGAVSEWSEPLVLSIAKNKIIKLNPLILDFLKTHLHLLPLLREIMLFLG